MLSRFFKPKWQHHDPVVRRRALDEVLDDGDEIVCELALNDPDIELRCVALKRVRKLDLLQRILNESSNPRVREHAQRQIHGLIAGTVDGLDAQQRSELLQAAEDVALLEHVARHGRDVELRTLAISRVTRQPLLLELATGDAAIAVRLVALQRVESSEHLQAICKQARGRDKRLYRAAQQRLQQQQALQQRPLELQRQYAELCTRAEALLKCSTPEAANAALAQLQQQWLALMAEAEPQPQSIDRFAEAVAALGEMESAWKQQQEAIKHGVLALIERLQSLTDEAADGELTQTRVDTLSGQLAACEQQWRALPQRPDEDELSRYLSLASALRQRLRSAGGELRALDQAQLACDRANALLGADGPVGNQQLRSLKRAWPANANDATLQRQFEQAIVTLQQRIDEQTRNAKDKLTLATELSGKLEQALEAGESRNATTLQQQIRELEKQLMTLGLDLPTTVQQRLQRLAGRLRELRDWQRFSNTTEREQLCEQVEALIAAELPVPELASRIKAARMQWNGLGSTDRDAIGALRERFNKACELAYQPCAAFYEQQGRERAANLAERSALCQRMQQFIEQTDWDAMDIKQVDALVRQSRDRWKQIGPVEHAAFKPVSKQYHHAMGILNGHLRKVRDANLKLKQGLLTQAQALAGDDVELAQAMDGIRDLQARWKQLGPAPRRQEQDIWKQFQQAGDAVFGRRNAERDAVRQQQQAGVAAREAICDQLQQLVDQAAAESLAQSDPGADVKAESGAASGTDSAALRAALRDIEQAWSEVPELPARGQGQVATRYRNLGSQMDELLAQQAAARSTARIKQAGEAALLVAEADAAVLDGALGDALQARWQALMDGLGTPERGAPTLKSMQQRWQRALQGAESDAHGEAAALLCLKMEVAAEVTSPPELAAARMALQVERLNQGLGEEGHDELAEMQALERDWWQLGGLPASDAQALTQRFLAARDAGYRRLGIPL